jgi:hypothetical protein
MGLENANTQQPQQTGVLNAVNKLQESRQTLDTQIQKMQESLMQRQKPLFNPELLALSKGFLKPTRTGSFFESAGNAADALESASDKSLEKQYAAQKLQMELLEKSVGLKQAQAGIAHLSSLSTPQSAPTGVPAVAPAGAPVAPVTAPVAAPNVSGGAEPVSTPVTTPVTEPVAEPITAGAAPSATAAPPKEEKTSAAAANYTPPPAITNAGVKYNNGIISAKGIGTYNLNEINIGPDQIAIAAAISPSHLKTVQAIADAQKDYRKYQLDVANFGIKQADLMLKERDTKVKEAQLAIDQARLKQNDFAEVDFGPFGRKKVALKVAQDYQTLLNSGANQDDIANFIKKNNLAETKNGKVLTEQELKIQSAGEEARAKESAALEAKDINALQKGSTQAKGIITLANNQISLAENSGEVFGYLNDNKLGSNILRVIESARVGQTLIKPDELSQLLKGVTDEKARDALSIFAQNTARMNLQLARLELKGEGSVSNSERDLVAMVNGIPTDSAGILSIKAHALKLAAERDIEMHQAWVDFKRSNKPDWSEFIESKQYKSVDHKYDAIYEKERQGVTKYLETRNALRSQRP